MKARIFFAIALLLCGAALVMSERQKLDAPVSPAALMHFIADSERELTRLPARFTRLDDTAEIKIGNDMAKFYASRVEHESADDNDTRRMSAYVEQIGRRLAPHANRKLPYKFHYIPHRGFVNAFALPGGHVYVGAGLIERFDSEDQLAAIIAHEIEHIDHYHCIERIQMHHALRKIPLGGFLGLPLAIMQAGYSKEQELEADREGMRLAARAGYSANGAPRAMEALSQLRAEVEEARKSPRREMSEMAIQILTEYFRSHPAPEMRMAELRAIIAREPALQGRAERDLEVAHITMAWRADDAITAGEYGKAAVLSARALQREPRHVPALRALAQARIGLGELDAARTAYQALVAVSPSHGEGVRLTAEAAARELIAKKEYAKAVAVLALMRSLQSNHPRILPLLAEAQVLAGDMDAAASTAETMRRLYPAKTAALSAQEQATVKLASGEFNAAAAYAWLALQFEPDLQPAMLTLGHARFGEARFREAAQAYAAAAEEVALEDGLVIRRYADALAASNAADAAQEFARQSPKWSFKFEAEAQVQVEEAGLRLMAGDAAPATQLRSQALAGALPPELLLRLGWWYMRAGRPEEGLQVLNDMMRARPGDPRIGHELGWTLLALARYDEAKEKFATSMDYAAEWQSHSMGNAIVLWRSGKPQQALAAYAAATRQSPEWLNPEWRSAFYPRTITDAIGEMHQEQERQRAAALSRLPKPKQ